MPGVTWIEAFDWGANEELGGGGLSCLAVLTTQDVGLLTLLMWGQWTIDFLPFFAKRSYKDKYSRGLHSSISSLLCCKKIFPECLDSLMFRFPFQIPFQIPFSDSSMFRFVQIPLWYDAHIFWFPYVQIPICSDSLVFRFPCVRIPLCSDSLMFRFPYVQIPLCPDSLMFWFPCVQILMCSDSHVFRFRYVQSFTFSNT